MRNRWTWGVLAVAGFIAASLLVARASDIAVRPLYDGLAPPAPYRYVDPPPDLEPENEAPEPGKGVVDLLEKGSSATSISTGDGQMQTVFPKGVFAARRSEKTVSVRITPRAPQPPLDLGDGSRIEGNAYEVTAKYSKSGDIAKPAKPVTVVIRYPVHSTVVVRRDGPRWTHLADTKPSTASQQLFANSDELGTFAAAGSPIGGRSWIPYIAAGLGVIAGIAGYLWGRRAGRKRKRKPKRRRRRRMR